MEKQGEKKNQNGEGNGVRKDSGNWTKHNDVVLQFRINIES